MAALLFLFTVAMAYDPLHPRVPGEIAFYEFQDNGTLAVDAGGNNSLILSPGITWNTNRTGLHFGSSHSGMVSQNTWGPLYLAINQSRSWTLEFWVYLENFLDVEEIVLAGFLSPSATYIPHTSITQVGNSTWAAFGMFRPNINDSMFISYYCNGTSNLESSTQVSVPGFIQNTITHLVYVVEQVPNNRVRFYQNGVNVKNVSRALDFIWTTSQTGYSLEVAPYLLRPTDNSSFFFMGDMYLFALYDRSLDPSEVMANFQAKIPNSVPVATNKTVNGTEDSINSFMAQVSDYDTTFSYENVTCSVLTLPSKGSLIKPDNSTATVPFFFSPSDVLGFKSQPAALSQQDVTFGDNYATITFNCMDHLGATSNVATIFFNLAHVNHAPVATNFTISINRTRTLIKIDTHVSDIDSPYIDLPSKGTIAALPLYGTIQNFNDGSNITTAPWNLTFLALSNALSFYYIPSPDTGVPGQAIVYSDTIPYSVIDTPPSASNAKRSNAAIITVNILNNLLISQSGSTTSTASGLQGNTTLFMLPGFDINGQPLDGYVLDLPSVGKLFLPNGTEITAAGPFPYLAGRNPNNASSNGVYLLYQPPPLFYGNVSFDYFLESRSDGWQSANGTLIFQVIYVNQPPTLTTNVTQVNISRTDSVHVNFTMNDVDWQASVQYSYRFRTTTIADADKNGTLYVSSDYNVTNITGNPLTPANNPTANGTYASIQQAISSMSLLGQNEGEGILTLYVFDYNVKLASGIKANASVSIYFKVTEPIVNPPKHLGQLEQILVYVAIAVGGSACIFCCCGYCYWSNKKQKKKYYEQGYAAEASAMSMDRL